MKKIVWVLILVLLLGSCTMFKDRSLVLPYFANFGESGEIVFTGKASYYIPDTPCIDRITLVFKDEEINGILEGIYTKLILKQVVKRNNIEINGRSDFDYVYYGFGKTFFSTTNADEHYQNRIKNGKPVIWADTARKMESADWAIYAKQPEIGFNQVDELLITVTGDLFSLECSTASYEFAEALFRLLKSDFNSFMIRQGSGLEDVIRTIQGTFSMEGNVVRITDLDSSEYLENWVRRIFNNGN